MKTLARMKGRQGGEGERFARLTQSLLECEAIKTLPHAAFKILTILAVGARGSRFGDRKDRGRNGVQAITDTYARRFGIASRDTVYRALDELLKRELIVRTRKGSTNRLSFALYAVAWLPITHRDGQPLDTPEPAPEGYLMWHSNGSDGKRKPPERKNLPSDDRTESYPMTGQDKADCRPIVSTSDPNCRPIVGNTLRILDRTSESSPRFPSHSQGSKSRAVEKLRSQVRALHGQLPHLTAADHARALKIADVQMIQTILAELQGNDHANDK
jgi:hypothetical protein